MIANISPKALSGVISAPCSKSEAHRILICAALSESETKIKGNLLGDDIFATIDVLKALGSKIETSKDGIIVNPIKKNNNVKLYIKESGSTLRFIIPIIAMLGINAEIDGGDRLRKRPIDDIVKTLSDAGITFSGDSLPISMAGQLFKDELSIDISKSSQFLTGLLLAAGMKNCITKINTVGKEVSGDYINITIDIMRRFGVKVEKEGNTYIVQGGYKSPKEIAVLGDWSGACFYAVAGAMGDVKINNLKLDSQQGDKRIIDVLKAVGAKVKENADGVGISKGELKPFEANIEDWPDAAPALSVLAAFCKGKSLIKGTSRLKIKESNRGEEIVKLLKEYNILAENHDDYIIINGGSPKGTTFKSPDDHRIAMAAAILSAYSMGDSSVVNVECVNKSYPEFFEDFKRLGGDISVSAI